MNNDSTVRRFSRERIEYADGTERTTHQLKVRHAITDESFNRMRSQIHSQAKYFRPTLAVITVTDGEVRDVHVSGPILKKDGQPGSMRGDQNWNGLSWGKAVTNGMVPGWLVELVQLAVQAALEDMKGSAPTESTPDAVRADTEALKAAGVPVRADALRKDSDGHVVLPTVWAAKGPESVSRDLRTFATRLQGLASDLDHAVAMHRIEGTGPALNAVTEALETTRDGMDATVQGLEGLEPTVLNLWMELAYGTEFARKYRKASRMVRDDL